jgi:hypothetical protein
MNPKQMKAYDFQQFLRTDNWNELMRFKMDGFTFSEAIRMVNIFQRTIRFHDRMSKELTGIMGQPSELGYESEALIVE